SFRVTAIHGPVCRPAFSCNGILPSGGWARICCTSSIATRPSAAQIGGANIPNAASRFQKFAAGKMISSPTANEAVVSERFIRDYGFEKPADAVGKTIELLAPRAEKPSAKASDKTAENNP